MSPATHRIGGSLLALCALFCAACHIQSTLALDQGEVVAVLSDGTELRERMLIKNRPFKWVRKAEFVPRSPNDHPQFRNDTMSDPALEAAERIARWTKMFDASDEELAHKYSMLALVGTEEYQEDLDEKAVATRAAEVRKFLMEKLEIATGVRDSSTMGGPRTPKGSKAPGNAAGKAQSDVDGPRDDNSTCVDCNGGDDADSVHPPSRKLLGGGKSDPPPPTPACPDSRSTKDNKAWPNKAVSVLGYGKSHITGQPNQVKSSSCTAAFIGESTALSAAHCFWDYKTGDWVDGYHWGLGYDSSDNDPSPYGLFKPCALITIMEGFTEQASQYVMPEFDFAVMTFEGCDIKSKQGTDPKKPGAGGRKFSGYWVDMPYLATSSYTNKNYYNLGYPGPGKCGSNFDDCAVRQWGSQGANNGPYVPGNAESVYFTSITSSGGHSGGPIYFYDNSGNAYLGCILLGSTKCTGQSYSTLATCRLITSELDWLIKAASVDF